jgi:hypothetical protein
MSLGLKEKEYIRTLKEMHSELTKRFDLEDWRTVRNQYYWLADQMAEGEGLVHKIKCIEYYINKGIPLK